MTLLLVLGVCPKGMSLLPISLADDDANQVHKLPIRLAFHIQVNLGGARRNIRRTKHVNSLISYREGMQCVMAYSGGPVLLSLPSWPKRVRDLS